MKISTITRQAYSELDEFLDLLSSEQKNQIPLKLREFFKREKDPNYVKNINLNEPIKNQNLKEETLALIALLNLQYWCKDEQEKERLKKVYIKNEKEYQEKLREEYNPDDIFKKKTSIAQKEQEKIKNNQIIEYEDSLIKRIINKIKNIFFR